MRILICLLCVILAVACDGQKNVAIDTEAYNTIPADTLTELLSIAGVPDSTLTIKKLESKRKLNLLLKKCLVVENNQFVLRAEPKDFEKAGLSKYYYYILKKSFKDLNHNLDSLGIQNVEEKFKKGSIENGFTLYSIENKPE